MNFVNPKAILEMLDFCPDKSPEMVLELLQVFFDLAPDLVRRIELSAQAKDAEGTRFIAHSLKSSSLALGCEELGNVCRDIEVLAKAGKLPSAEVLQKLQVVFSGSLAELNDVCTDLGMKKSA